MEMNAESEMLVTKKLYRECQVKVLKMELTLKEVCEENTKIWKQFEEVTEKCKLMENELAEKTKQLAEKQSNEAYMKEKLWALLEKFKKEATDESLKWLGEESIQCALDGFESVVRIIMDDEPHIHPLVDQVATYMDTRAAKDEAQKVRFFPLVYVH